MSTLERKSCEAVGGKASVLLELQHAGFAVPQLEVSSSDLAEAVARVGGFPVAVRSSASLEDGQSFSFAGQFRSYLGLGTLDEVEEAVRDCHESLNSAAVKQYCCRNIIDVKSLRMHVIVQRMLQPELAGVVFTINPVTGAEEIVVEACEGLAAPLLAGRATALPTDHPLVQRYLPEIESVARQIQRYFGSPQDIEFAVQNGTVFVLQARPVTSTRFVAGTGEWTNADFRDGGVSSGVCSPLMWSLYQLVWDHSLKACLREVRLWNGDFVAGRMFYGRPYWNLGAVKQCVARVPGFVERRFDTDLNVQITYEEDGIRTPVNCSTLLRAIPMVFAVRKFLRRQVRVASQMLAVGSGPMQRIHEPIPLDIIPAFRDLIRRDYFELETNYFRTIFAVSLAKMDFLSSFPESDYPSLIAALPTLKHMAPLYELRRMAANGERDAAMFAHRYRHHSRWGLDIRFPRWDEDHEFVSELLERTPAAHTSDPRPAYLRARSEALAQLPVWRRGSFQRKLDRLRKLVWLREEMRDLSNHMYYLIRRYVLDIARRRHLGDDVFLMTFSEILTDDRAHIERRRHVFEGYRNFAAPNEIGGRYQSAGHSGSGDLTGIGVSTGSVQGPARIARSVCEAMKAEQGEILVCPFAEPGWIPVLDRISGVVAETGGLLSHAAVICREYGIPAVLGVHGATRRISAGKMIRVHGDRGYVEILD